MKAIFLEQPGELVIQEVPAPECTAGMITVRVEAVAICDDDLSAYMGETEYQRYPIIPGRDAVGIVVEVGAQARGEPDGTSSRQSGSQESDGTNHRHHHAARRFNPFVPPDDDDPHVISFASYLNPKPAVGDRVVILPGRAQSDADSPACDGRSREDFVRTPGFNIDGTLREFTVVPSEQCAVLPEGILMKEGLFLASTCKAQNAVDAGGVDELDTVTIMGAGDVGIIAAQIVLAHGARPILVDPSQARLELARSLGITHTINPFAAYAAEEIEWITSGDMADVVIDTAGDAEGMGSCLQFAGVGGRVVFTRKPAAKAPADLRYVVKRELSVHTCRNARCDADAALRLLTEGHVRVDPLVSATLPFEAAPFIIPSIARNPGHYMRVVLSSTPS
ncbi:MAG: zinc-dependent alcohol dehydrogenase [bacterium]